MDYECQAMPFGKLVMDGDGVKHPLCNDCVAPDCTNPIRDHIVSVLGAPTKMRLWTVQSTVRQVVMCKGYVSEKNVVVRTNQEDGDRPEVRDGGIQSADAPGYQ